MATTIGQSYLLLFHAGKTQSTGDDNNVTVNFGATNIFNSAIGINEGNVYQNLFGVAWTNTFLDIVATSTSTDLDFFLSNDSGTEYLDSVALWPSEAPVSGAPEPASTVLLGSGLMGIAAVVRRRRSIA